MNSYVTGATIKKLREAKGITQNELAEKIGVTSKAVSKWETSKGLPDITLIEPLSKILGISVVELMSGDTIINKNTSSNMLLSKFYVCPVCGNIIHTTGESLISCCGIVLPSLEAEEIDESHSVIIENVEDETFIKAYDDRLTDRTTELEESYCNSLNKYGILILPEKRISEYGSEQTALNIFKTARWKLGIFPQGGIRRNRKIW